MRAANCYKHDYDLRRKTEEFGFLYDLYVNMQPCLKTHPTEAYDEHEIDNDFSLQVASRMSINLIPKQNRGMKDLLFFLSCLPGGIQRS